MIAGHATVYNKNIHEKGRTTKDCSQRDQQQGKCFHHAALSAKTKLNSIWVGPETVAIL